MKNTLQHAWKSKFYLQTWFINLIMLLTIFNWIFFFIAATLTIFQFIVFNRYIKKYGKGEMLEKSLSDLETAYEWKKDELEQEYKHREQYLNNSFFDTEREIQIQIEKMREELSVKETEIEEANNELAALQAETLIAYYDFSDYDALSSEDCKNKLVLLKNDEKKLVKSGQAIAITSDSTKKVINDNIKQILRCFNSECDNILMSVSGKNIDSMRNKITKSYETLNKIFSVDGISLKKELLEYKLEELNLVYTAEIKREQEHELQKAIKEQMLEEEKVRREIEAQKAKIEKDQLQCSKEIDKLMSYMQKSQNDTEKQLYIDKIKELEEKLKELEASKETVLEREANARAGFVYVISNIGSFGEDIYKIGMTRRLEPMDRIKELSSASVPFEFDVHAMIFANDAPALETCLHQHFEKQSVNRVNLRKEFFKVTLDEIEQVVKNNYNNTVEFTRIPVAAEYRQTLDILSSETSLSLYNINLILQIRGCTGATSFHYRLFILTLDPKIQNLYQEMEQLLKNR